MKTEILVDLSRTHLPETGFYVRARSPTGVASHDIAHLTRESLTQWLRAKDVNEFGLTIILSILGHTR